MDTSTVPTGKAARSDALLTTPIPLPLLARLVALDPAEAADRLFGSSPALNREHPPPVGRAGVTRLHYTLATGLVTAKTGVGRYALATFPARWHRIARECLRIRRGDRAPSLYPHPVARRATRVIASTYNADSAAGTADRRSWRRRHPYGVSPRGL